MPPSQRRAEQPRPLAQLLEAAGLENPGPGPGPLITGVAADSRRVEPGSLFVAIRGTAVDGHRFLAEAAERGAGALVVEEAPDPAPGIPVLRVDDSRRALARLAAAWYGHPAERLSLVGLTGTVGKTSVLTMLEAVFEAAGRPLGAVGSLGIRVRGRRRDTGHTAPDPLQLHEGLAEIQEAGCRVAAMEVTSHALVQQRVHGLCFDQGAFTNLVPLEHSDFHGSFRGYVEAKSRFFDHLAPGAVLVYNADDRAVRRLVRDRGLALVGVGTGARTADMHIEIDEIALGGTQFRLTTRRPLPLLDGGESPPRRLELQMALLGRANIINASIAAALALGHGIDDEAIRAGLRRLVPPRRRLEVIHDDEFLVVDDTVGHPDSISALFEVVERLPARRIHVVFAIRGSRGARINRRTAEALAIWLQRRPATTLVVTRSEDAADERNRVSRPEEEAFLLPLREAGIPFLEHPTLAGAVPAALREARSGDLVLLLGAQGMDAGAEHARAWLRSHARSGEHLY